jgi:mRNA-degrading endonuclease YafQ of YafQ-DinJ toxin-antitoxin module
MFIVCYKPSFVRQFKKLPIGLQEEALARIALFRNPKNHTLLGVHKLHGKLKKYSGFSVDFQNRIVFDFLSENEVVLLSVGNHDIYR